MTVFLLISSTSHTEIHLVLRKSWIDEGGLSGHTIYHTLQPLICIGGVTWMRW